MINQNLLSRMSVFSRKGKGLEPQASASTSTGSATTNPSLLSRISQFSRRKKVPDAAASAHSAQGPIDAVAKMGSNALEDALPIEQPAVRGEEVPDAAASAHSAQGPIDAVAKMESKLSDSALPPVAYARGDWEYEYDSVYAWNSEEEHQILARFALGSAAGSLSPADCAALQSGRVLALVVEELESEEETPAVSEEEPEDALPIEQPAVRGEEVPDAPASAHSAQGPTDVVAKMGSNATGACEYEYVEYVYASESDEYEIEYVYSTNSSDSEEKLFLQTLARVALGGATGPLTPGDCSALRSGRAMETVVEELKEARPAVAKMGSRGASEYEYVYTSESEEEHQTLAPVALDGAAGSPTPGQPISRMRRRKLSDTADPEYAYEYDAITVDDSEDEERILSLVMSGVEGGVLKQPYRSALQNGGVLEVFEEEVEGEAEDGESESNTKTGNIHADGLVKEIDPEEKEHVASHAQQGTHRRISVGNPRAAGREKQVGRASQNKPQTKARRGKKQLQPSDKKKLEEAQQMVIAANCKAQLMLQTANLEAQRILGAANVEAQRRLLAGKVEKQPLDKQVTADSTPQRAALAAKVDAQDSAASPIQAGYKGADDPRSRQQDTDSDGRLDDAPRGNTVDRAADVPGQNEPMLVDTQRSDIQKGKAQQRKSSKASGNGHARTKEFATSSPEASTQVAVDETKPGTPVLPVIQKEHEQGKPKSMNSGKAKEDVEKQPGKKASQKPPAPCKNRAGALPRQKKEQARYKKEVSNLVGMLQNLESKVSPVEAAFPSTLKTSITPRKPEQEKNMEASKEDLARVKAKLLSSRGFAKSPGQEDMRVIKAALTSASQLEKQLLAAAADVEKLQRQMAATRQKKLAAGEKKKLRGCTKQHPIQ